MSEVVDFTNLLDTYDIRQLTPLDTLQQSIGPGQGLFILGGNRIWNTKLLLASETETFEINYTSALFQLNLSAFAVLSLIFLFIY